MPNLSPSPYRSEGPAPLPPKPGRPGLVGSLCAFLIRRRKSNAALAALGALSFACFSVNIRFENSVESFISPKDPGLRYYQRFKSEFGDDRMLALVFPAGEVFTRESLLVLQGLSARIEELPGVRKVHSLTATQDIAGTEGGFTVRPFIEEVPEGGEALERLKAASLGNPLHRLDLVSLDGRIASLLIELEASSKPDRYKEVAEGIRGVVADSPLKDREYHLAGNPLVELQMTRDMWRDLRIFVPATYACLGALLLLCFRSVRAVLGLLGCVSLCLLFLLGLMGAAGVTMNAVTSGLPSLILCIAVLDSVHILNLHRAGLARGLAPEEALRWSLGENLKPCFLTSLTTSIGFASIAVSGLVPIRQFGLLASAATAAAYPICLAVMPVVALWPRPEELAQGAREKRAFAALFARLRALYERRALMLALVGAVAALSLAGASRIRTETIFINFMNPDSPIRRATDYIQANLAGISPLEIVIDTGREGGVKEPQVLRQIERLQEFLAGMPEIDKSVSPVQFIKEMHQAMNAEDPRFYAVPDSRDLVAQYLLIYSMSGRENDMDDFVDYTYQTARVRSRINPRRSAELAAVLRRIEDFARRNFDPGLDVRLTSHSVIQADMMGTLIEGQVKGLLIALALMTLVLSAASRSWVVGAFAMVPNILPLIATFGVMGAAGISLNAGSAMTACIAFGLVVDDTIYFFHHASSCLRGRAPGACLDSTLEKVGPAVAYTSLTLAAAFAILMLGRSYFTASFGFLCAFMIAAACLTDLLVTPFLIYHFPALQRGLSTGKEASP